MNNTPLSFINFTFIANNKIIGKYKLKTTIKNNIKYLLINISMNFGKYLLRCNELSHKTFEFSRNHTAIKLD